MPDGRLTKYIAGRGNIVVGFKAPTATVNFIYNPVTGFCPVTNSQLKNAKEQLPINICECIIHSPPICPSDVIYDGGNHSDEFCPVFSDEGNGPSIDGGNQNTKTCGK